MNLMSRIAVVFLLGMWHLVQPLLRGRRLEYGVYLASVVATSAVVAIVAGVVGAALMYLMGAV